jgi:hypothetical protein
MLNISLLFLVLTTKILGINYNLQNMAKLRVPCVLAQQFLETIFYRFLNRQDARKSLRVWSITQAKRWMLGSCPAHPEPP